MGLLLMKAEPRTLMDDFVYAPFTGNYHMVFKSPPGFTMDDRRYTAQQEGILGRSAVDERRRARNRLAQRKHRQRKREARQQHPHSTPETAQTTPSFVSSDPQIEPPFSLQPDEPSGLSLLPGTPKTTRSERSKQRSPTPEDSHLETPRGSEELTVPSTSVHELTSFPTQTMSLDSLEEFEDFFTTAAAINAVPAWSMDSTTEILDPWIPPFPEELMFPPPPPPSWPAHDVPQTISHLSRESGFIMPALHAAAQQGDERLVRHMLQSGTPLDELDSGGWTALHHAASGGHAGTVSALLENGADYDITDRLGWTALQVATGRGHDHIVALMTEFGVS